MFRRLSDKFKKDEKAEKPSIGDKRKPIFPAYVPSHMNASQFNPDNKYNQGMYETNQIYVSNLPRNTNMDEINRAFPQCVGISLGVNEANESNAAYIEFTSSEDADRACNETKGASIRGNTLIISPKLRFN